MFTRQGVSTFFLNNGDEAGSCMTMPSAAGGTELAADEDYVDGGDELDELLGILEELNDDAAASMPTAAVSAPIVLAIFASAMAVAVC